MDSKSSYQPGAEHYKERRTDSTSALVNSLCKVRWVVPFYKTKFDPESLEEDFELVKSAAIKVRGSENVVACFCDSCDCQKLCRLAA